MSPDPTHPLVKAVTVGLGFTGTAADFYQEWWSGVPTGDIREAGVGQSLHPPQYALYVQSHSDGEVQSTGGQLVSVGPGEYYVTSDIGRVIMRRKSWSNQQWNWFQSCAPRTYPRSQIPKRIYIPSFVGGKSNSAEELSEQLDKHDIYFILKQRRMTGVFRDFIVVYSDEISIKSIALTIADMGLEHLLDPPPLANSWRGIGIVDDRLDGESVGWIASQLIWKSTRSASQNDSMEFVSRHFVEPDRPWISFSHDMAFWDWLESHA
jgi:hypothetical protein